MTRWDTVYITAFASIAIVVLLICLLTLISKGIALKRQFWSQPANESAAAGGGSLGTAEIESLTDDLCKLAHLQRWHSQYSKHLNKAYGMQSEIEPLLADKQLSPDQPELWQKWLRLQGEWTTELRATNNAYQQAFGENKDLSLSLKWNVGQTPIEGAKDMHPDAAAAKRSYYDQKDRLYQKMPGMNRRFHSSIDEANQAIWAHGRERLLKDIK